MKSVSERPQPHVRDLKKLSVSTSFGVSKVKQAVADIGENLSAEVATASYSSNNDEDDN